MKLNVYTVNTLRRKTWVSLSGWQTHSEPVWTQYHKHVQSQTSNKKKKCLKIAQSYCSFTPSRYTHTHTRMFTLWTHLARVDCSPAVTYVYKTCACKMNPSIYRISLYGEMTKQVSEWASLSHCQYLPPISILSGLRRGVNQADGGRAYTAIDRKWSLTPGYSETNTSTCTQNKEVVQGPESGQSKV